MRTSIEGIIFDLDGTLIDSRRDIAAGVNHALAVLGHGPLSEEQIGRYVGDGIHDLLACCLKHFSAESLAEKGVPVFKEHYRRHLLDATRLCDGVEDLLRHFSSKKMAVISNKPEAFTLRILEELGIRRYFGPVLGGDSLPLKKPDPAPLIKVLGEWRLEPDQALMVGDSANDMRPAKKIGMRTCGVTYGFKDETHVRACEPDWVVARLLDLKDIVC